MCSSITPNIQQMTGKSKRPGRQDRIQRTNPKYFFNRIFKSCSPHLQTHIHSSSPSCSLGRLVTSTNEHNNKILILILIKNKAYQALILL